jgi:P pilus assembly chaperone PapD
MVAAAALAAPHAALAALTLSPLILDLSADQSARGDVELFNNGQERLYVVAAPYEVADPGKPSERRVENPDPEALGLLATPNRLILEPGQRKFLRISMLKPAGEADRIFRVTVKPVVGDVTAQATGLKIMVGYEMLVIQRPLDPQAKLAVDRKDVLARITNAGNTNAELFQGQACAPSGECAPLPSHRVYAGATVEIPVKPGFKARYTVKVRDKITTLDF